MMTARDHNQNTIAEYREHLRRSGRNADRGNDLCRSLRIVAAHLVTTFEKAETGEVVEILDMVRESRDWSASSIQLSKTALHGLYNWLAEHGRVTSDPVPYGKRQGGRKETTIAMREFIASCHTEDPSQIIHYHGKAYSLAAVMSVYLAFLLPGKLYRLISMTPAEKARAEWRGRELKRKIGWIPVSYTEAELVELSEAYKRGRYRIELEGLR